jgi:urease accessory protein
LNSETNPDLGLDPGLDRVGRDGFLRLQFERRGARTILAQSRFTLPLQAMAPTTLDDGTAYLMLLNPTGGVLGGDHLVTGISQQADTRVCLTTPSATRIYRTAERPAILETTIAVGEGATLEYLPDHVIPHERSALRQSLRVEMGAGSRAIVLDAIASGRVAHGERWEFTEMDSRMEVLVCGRPVFLNRTRIIPPLRNPRDTGLMEEFDYLACLGIFADTLQDWNLVTAALNAELSRAPQICGGVSMLSRGGCVVRFLARSAADMTSLNRRLWDIARALVIQAPVFDHRKY